MVGVDNRGGTWEVLRLIINLSISWFETRKIPGPGAYLGPGLVDLWFYLGFPSHLRATKAHAQGIRAGGGGTSLRL